MSGEAERPGGTLESLRNLAGSLLAAVHTRLDIVATELEEDKVRLARIAVLAGVLGVSAALAVNLFAIFLAVLFWDSHRLLAIGGLVAVFAAAAAIAGVKLRSALAERPRLFSATLAELRKDRGRPDQQ